ncbi:DUF4376 domain-containing protein [Chromobacterium vaccinii]|nr:DUF4376 domain-containing protein [Chromobacterium vaccinii]QND89896.1 DUF4376 domain-containing protein [Chromobacterium vaccinii]
MKAFFSASTLGFYLSEVCPKSSLPNDCVETSYDTYKAMVLAPIPAGFELAADEAGNPVLRQVLPPSLDALRAAAASRVNAARDRVEASGFPYLGAMIDSDSRSVERINTAAMAALIAKTNKQQYSIDWKTAGNEKMPLDADGMLGLQAALQAWGRRALDEADRRKAAIAAANSGDEIAAIEAKPWS